MNKLNVNMMSVIVNNNRMTIGKIVQKLTIKIEHNAELLKLH